MRTPTHTAPPTLADLIVVAGRVVLPEGERAAAVEVHDGRITAIHDPGAVLPAAREFARLPPDEVLLPALVDSHVHANEPGRTAWEGLRSLTRAAAAGGIGTVVDMPLNCVPATVSAAAVAAKRSACPEPAVDVALWGGAVDGGLFALPELAAAGVRGFKAFMVDSGVPEFPPLTTDEALREAMTAAHALGLPLLVHAEDAAEVAAAPAPHPTAYAGLLASRPVASELRAIERLAALSAETGAHVHVVHVSSAEGVAALAAAQDIGTPISGETCPHYLTLCAEELPDGDPRTKCFPPIREARHRDGLWEGLRSGVLSLIASDHSPAPWALKGTGDLATAWGGIASLQLSLPVTWTAARQRGFTLGDIAQWMADGPARLAGLGESKGRIAVGLDADLIAFDPDRRFVVDGTALWHRHPENPYEGRELRGVVRRTWLRGRAVDSRRPHGAWR